MSNILMFPTPLTTFVHPQSVYRLDHPAHWDQVIEKEGASCGFGPHERDDVGLWISIMPMSVDTEKLPEALPGLMQQALHDSGSENLRQDKTLRHYGLVADIAKDGEGGHYWIIAGGDVVLFASSQVPVAEREVWNPPFQQLMASLQITRDRELLFRQVANEVMAQLKKRKPDQEFEFDGNKIRGGEQVVYLSNVFRDVQAAPESRRDGIIKHFVNTLTQPGAANIGHETWEEVQTCIVPVLKPKNYIDPKSPTQHLLTTEWLADVLICYVIKSKKMFRFVTGWDVNRWGTDAHALHDLALRNLATLPWPREMMGSAAREGGRVVIVDCDDSLASSRLLHPELYKLFSPGLGRPFWAGIPCRNTLVLFSDRRVLKQRIARRLKKDHDASAYPISPLPFLVTQDGIAPGGAK